MKNNLVLSIASLILALPAMAQANGPIAPGAVVLVQTGAPFGQDGSEHIALSDTTGTVLNSYGNAAGEALVVNNGGSSNISLDADWVSPEVNCLGDLCRGNNVFIPAGVYFSQDADPSAITRSATTGHVVHVFANGIAEINNGGRSDIYVAAASILVAE